MTPAPNLSGESTITVKVSDGAASASSTFKVTVTAVNDAPVNNVPGTQTTTEDNASDPLVFSSAKGNAITVSDVDAGNANIKTTLTLTPADGTLVLGSTANVTFTGNNSGKITVTGKIADINNALNGLKYISVSPFYVGNVTLNVLTEDLGNSPAPPKSDSDDVTIDVQPKVRPLARPDSKTVVEDSLANNPANAINVMANDIFNVGATGKIISFTDGANGTVTRQLNDVNDESDDQLIYTPNANFFGSDSFDYTINDSSGKGANSTTKVSVTVSEVNDPPIANPDTVATKEDQVLSMKFSELTANDSPGPGETQDLTIVNVTMVDSSKGKVAIVGKDVVFTPSPFYNNLIGGPAEFNYTVQDSGGLTATALVTVNISEVNNNPVPGDNTSKIGRAHV